MLLYNEHGFRVSGISLPVGIMRISTAFPFLNEHSTAQRASRRHERAFWHAFSHALQKHFMIDGVGLEKSRITLIGIAREFRGALLASP
jgi:hypothetical protein